MSFQIGSTDKQYLVYMRPKDYLMNFGTNNCAVLVNEETDSKAYILGDSFLRAYYSIYDMENTRVGLVGMVETVKIKKPKI